RTRVAVHGPRPAREAPRAPCRGGLRDRALDRRPPQGPRTGPGDRRARRPPRRLPGDPAATGPRAAVAAAQRLAGALPEPDVADGAAAVAAVGALRHLIRGVA